jgi:hypothetical protein
VSNLDITFREEQWIAGFGEQSDEENVWILDT